MILAWMLHASAVGVLLALAARCLEGVVRLRGWPVRGLWVLALLGSVLLPVLPLVEPRADSVAPAAGSVDAAIPAAATEAAPWLDWSGALVRVAAPGRGPDLDLWLLGLWGAASAALCLSLALSLRALARRRREWRDGEVEGLRVWISRDLGPAVVGAVRARIVLPEWVLHEEEGRRALILAHEEEHLRAGDPRLLLGAFLVPLALPWNPAAWWLWKSLRRAVEIDCDRRVLARGAEPRAYGRLLVEVTERGSAHRLAVAALSESPSFLERRIRLLLAPRPRRWWPRLAVPAAFSALLVAAACQMEQPQAPRPERATLWIAPGGGYHLQDPGSEPIPLDRLASVLREALADSHAPTLLNVRAYRGVNGYDIIMAKNAACDAGARSIDFAGNLPPGTRDPAAGADFMRGTMEIAQPCASARSAQPDTPEIPVTERPVGDPPASPSVNPGGSPAVPAREPIGFPVASRSSAQERSLRVEATRPGQRVRVRVDSDAAEEGAFRVTSGDGGGVSLFQTDEGIEIRTPFVYTVATDAPFRLSFEATAPSEEVSVVVELPAGRLQMWGRELAFRRGSRGGLIDVESAGRAEMRPRPEPVLRVPG